MKVVTLNQEQFAAKCLALASAVESDGFTPDLIVGIPSGGSHVADELSHRWPAAARCDICLQRQSTPLKNRLPLRLLFRLMPMWLLNLLKRAEAAMLRRRQRDAATDSQPVEISAEQQRLLSSFQGRNILIADDAVDSGLTIRRIAATVRQYAPDATIRTAVIVVTQHQQLPLADHTLYVNHLIRFPWSLDARR